MFCKSLFTKQMSWFCSAMVTRMFYLPEIWLTKVKGEKVYENLTVFYYQIKNLFLTWKIIYRNHHNFSKRGKYIQWSSKMVIFKVWNRKNLHPLFFVSEVKTRNKEIKVLETKIKTFELNLTNKESNEDYFKCKRILNYIFDQKKRL